LLLVVLWVLMLGCNFSGIANRPNVAEVNRAQTSTAQAVQGVQETVSKLATQTAQAQQIGNVATHSSPSPASTPATPSATDIPLTNINVPATLDRPRATHEINFTPGGTSIYLEKKIKPGEPHVYSIHAQADQTLIVTANSPGNDVFLNLKGLQDGVQLLRSAEQASYWFGKLTETQDYQITLATDNPDTYYFLSVEIPVDIYFAPGASSEIIEGFIDVDQDYHPAGMTRVRYLVGASAGQTMAYKLTSPNLDALSLGILGQQDGQVYSRYEVKNSSGALLVPVTQRYYMDVYSVDGVSTAFELEVTIK
jgi:hypothetical protein